MSLYRDVPPTQYVVTVDSYLDSYVYRSHQSISLPERRPTSKSCPCGGQYEWRVRICARHFLHTHYPGRHRLRSRSPPLRTVEAIAEID
jgi:hypothetical protein